MFSWFGWWTCSCFRTLIYFVDLLNNFFTIRDKARMYRTAITSQNSLRLSNFSMACTDDFVFLYEMRTNIDEINQWMRNPLKEIQEVIPLP